METHSSILAWRISLTAEPRRLPSIGSQSQTWPKWLSTQRYWNSTCLIWIAISYQVHQHDFFFFNNVECLKLPLWCVCAQSCPTLQPHGLQGAPALQESARLLCLWNFPGKNTGVGCHFFLQGNLPDPGVEPMSLVSPALADGFFTTLPPGKPKIPFKNL